MKRFLYSSILWLCLVAPVAAEVVPQWIWTSKEAKSETIYARRAFTISQRPKTAKLSITCDNGFTAYVKSAQSTIREIPM